MNMRRTSEGRSFDRLPEGRAARVPFSWLILASILALVAVACLSSAQTDPPSTGDWNIFDSTTLTNNRVTVPGDINIYSGGSLTLTDVDLTFSHMSWGDKTFRVGDNARLTMTGGSITHSSIDHSYQFVIENGATVSMDGVMVKHTWHDSTTDRYSYDLAGGMQIRSNTVTVTNCTFTEQLRVAMTINNANPKITNCTFLKTQYFTYHIQFNYIPYYYREAIGIMIINGAPEIIGCTFNEIGDFESAFNDAADGASTYLLLYGHGVYSIRGAPKIKECTFTEVGRIHSQYSFYTYVEKVNRYLRFYVRQEYGVFRGAIHAINPIMLEVFDCNFTHNYEGYYYYTNQASGVYQDDGKSSIKGNVFWANGGSGVYLNNAEALLKDNEMYDFYYYGLYITGNGAISAQNNTFNGTATTRYIRYETGVYIYVTDADLDLRSNRISFCQYGFSITTVEVVDLYDSVVTNCTRVLYANAAVVNIYNMTLGPEDIAIGYTKATVNIHFYLGVTVTWQNGIPVPGAKVVLTNGTGGPALVGTTDGSGRIPPAFVVQLQITGESSRWMTTINNTDLNARVTAGGLHTDLIPVPFSGNVDAELVIWDRTRPQLLVSTPSPHGYHRDRTLLVSGIALDVGSGLDRVLVSVDGEDWHLADGLEEWNVTLTLDEGAYDIIVQVHDLVSNTTVEVRNVTIDLGPPLLTVTSPGHGHAQALSDLSIHGTASDSGSGVAWVKVSIDGEQWILAHGRNGWNQTLDVPDGVHDLHVMAADQGGDTTQVIVRDIMVDTVLPVANAGPDLNTDQSTPVALNGTRSLDNLGISTWTWEFQYEGEIMTLEGVVVVFHFEIADIYDVTLRVTDGLGHASTDRLEVTVYDTELPVARAGENFVVDQGEEVTFDGQASTDNVGIHGHVWTFEDGDPFMTRNGEQISYVFQTPGVHTVTLTVTDLAGNRGEDVLTVTVFDIEPPEAVPGGDRIVIQGMPVSFDASSSTDNVGVIWVRWSFEEEGMQREVLEQAFTWRFDEVGIHDVVLRVQDAAGNTDSTMVLVHVLPRILPVPIGPFEGEGGKPVPRVEVMVDLNGTAYHGVTNEEGWLDVQVDRFDLGPTAQVQAAKEGWEPLDFTLDIDEDGQPQGSPPPMVREPVEESSSSSWQLVIIVAIAVGAVMAWMGLRRPID